MARGLVCSAAVGGEDEDDDDEVADEDDDDGGVAGEDREEDDDDVVDDGAGDDEEAAEEASFSLSSSLTFEFLKRAAATEAAGAIGGTGAESTSKVNSCPCGTTLAGSFPS